MAIVDTVIMVPSLRILRVPDCEPSTAAKEKERCLLAKLHQTPHNQLQSLIHNRRIQRIILIEISEVSWTFHQIVQLMMEGHLISI